jgi:nucleotide-binding universal stress UspA family protein
VAARTGFRRVVVGLDGSPHARRAAAFVARLSPPPRGGLVTFVRVVEPMRVPAMPLVPNAMRAQIAAQADTINQGRIALARRHVEAAATKLERAGWRARGVVRTGQPLTELLGAARAARAEVLVLGARGAGAVTHFLLGSTAEAALKHAAIPVLIVK